MMKLIYIYMIFKIIAYRSNIRINIVQQPFEKKKFYFTQDFLLQENTQLSRIKNVFI